MTKPRTMPDVLQQMAKSKQGRRLQALADRATPLPAPDETLQQFAERMHAYHSSPLAAQDKADLNRLLQEMFDLPND